MEHLEIYSLQDQVIHSVMNPDNQFYLTGGTALHRFYYHARHSFDLDFFESEQMTFHEDVREATGSMRDNGLTVELVVTSRDFYRILVNNTLKVDFVNDRVFRYGKSKVINGVRVDNIINILTNKLCAIVSRDEPKDVFDLFCIAFHERFNWDAILEIANKKAVVEREILIYRLKTFPLDSLRKLHIINELPIGSNEVEKIVEDIKDGAENTLHLTPNEKYQTKV